MQSVRAMPCQSQTAVEETAYRAPERSGQQLRSRAVTVRGCESRLLRAAGVLRTLCSLCEPTRKPQTSVCRNKISLNTSCSLWRALPANPPIQITGWVTQGDQHHPATFSFHLILCTVYTITKHTKILAFNFRFYSHVMYLFSSKAQQHLFAFLPLNLCYLPPSMQVHFLMHNV